MSTTTSENSVETLEPAELSGNDDGSREMEFQSESVNESSDGRKKRKPAGDTELIVKNVRGSARRLPIWNFFQQGTVKRSSFWEAICLACLDNSGSGHPVRGEKRVMEAHFYKCPYVDQLTKDTYRSGTQNFQAENGSPPLTSEHWDVRESIPRNEADEFQRDESIPLRRTRKTFVPRKSIHDNLASVQHDSYATTLPPSICGEATTQRTSTSAPVPVFSQEEERFVQYIYGVLGTVEPANKKRYMQAIKCAVAKLDLEIAAASQE
ncbi:uncharacterized protein LOC129588135 isoform X2 [Paramacrobiotus metropolitanus]|uniref:uncharacterized protein LOC129588135 isoform X2 n=2 Tax=Paramacrobiotus metropolitanus TaxID=2943436 RepID=UPI002445B587|nr:uncharacterized protein LOC129588135 isoform X2 [Paramacrobiotus metropolitanus]